MDATRNWTDAFITSIVSQITGTENIVPIIGPEVFFVQEGEDRFTLQEYTVKELFKRYMPDEVLDTASLQTFADGFYGMTKLGKLMRKRRINLENMLYSLYNDRTFMAQICIDKDVCELLTKGHFPLILTTCNFRFLHEHFTFHGVPYSIGWYAKKQVTDDAEHDIILRSGQSKLEKPVVFHLLGLLDPLGKDCVVTEDSFLQYLHYLHDSGSRPSNLMTYLNPSNNKFLFILGCDIPDWTFRFLLSSLKLKDGKPQSAERGTEENVFEGGAVGNSVSEEVAEFLSNLKYYSGNRVNAFLQDINKKLPSEHKPKVFLSMASEDYEKVGDKLHKRLTPLFDVWYYKYNGEKYAYWNDPERGIEAGLKDSEFILPIITPAAIDKIDDYNDPEQLNDDIPGLIEEWKRAIERHVKCCPIYVGRDVERLKKALKKSNCCDMLWPFFFPEDGAAGLPPIDLDNFKAEELYNHIASHLKG